MCMGFGCNAAGVVGCRIIDSPRERLVAILTNSLVPCNGRFPAMISLLAIYFTGLQTGGAATLYSALLLTGVLVLGVVATLFLSWLLSSTLLKGTPSSFALELPPYRRPQVGQVIVRSIFDRTLFVLGRAVLVAAPAGLLIWMLGNIQVSGVPLLTLCAHALDPIGRCIGLDGVILLAFILGFPANEIVLPLTLMGYLSVGTLVDTGSLADLAALLTANGWTATTALCFIL
ncbi:MAG: ferrous iron transporter B, partial [Butyricicoccus pullicaecorum]|nr:ferrous iron transporter B [Butyricicoccus pullicaecorum]